MAFWPFGVALFVLYAIIPRGCDAAALTWKSCPSGTLGTDCASIPVPLDYSAPHLGNITYFIRRFYSATPTNEALWMLQGGPGFDGSAFQGVAGEIVLRDPSLTVYVPDQRGTGRSSRISCQNQPGFSFNPSNPSDKVVIDECVQDILKQFVDVLPYYTTLNSALDIRTVVSGIDCQKLSFYALSYGTYLMNQYLQLPDARADAVVLDGPVPPDRWVLETNSLWWSRVSQLLLELCGRSSTSCREALALDGSVASFTMDSLIDGTLPCLASLPELTHFAAAAASAMLVGNQTLHVLMGPFWNRLRRCSPSDVVQLTHFFATVQQAAGTPDTEYSWGLGINVGMAELYSFAGPNATSYSEQLVLNSKLFASSGTSLAVAYAREHAWEPYIPNASTYRKFSRPQCPVLILSGTLDPNTPHGLGVWLHNGLGKNATLLTVPYAAHGTVNPNAPCVMGIALDFLLSFGRAPVNASCLDSIPAPDFEGVTPDSAALSRMYFGSDHLWNN